MREHSKPVFYTARATRRTAFRLSIWLVSLFLLFLTASLFLSFSTTPILPQLKVAAEKGRLTASLVSKGWATVSEKLNLAHARAPLRGHAVGLKRYAFYNAWDDNSFFSLREHASKLDVLLPEWLHISGDAGAFTPDDAREEARTRLWIQKNAPHLAIMPVLNSYNVGLGDWDGDALGRLLASDASKAALTSNILDYLKDHNLAGIVLDFKMLPDESIGDFVAFVRELQSELKLVQRKLLVVVPAYEQRIALTELAEAADQLVLLLYDQHWEGGAAGPLSAQGWFEAQLDRAFEKIAGEKIIVAVASLAVDWSSNGDAERIPIETAWDRLEESQSSFVFDGESLNGTFAYVASDQSHHTVWLLDGVTAYNQIAATLAMKPGGLALFRLGTEDPGVWTTLGRGRMPEKDVLPQLQTLEPNSTILYHGEGEVLSASDRRAPGYRKVDYNREHNLITAQHLTQLPRSLTIKRWGHNWDKLLALTFDDGPSSAYTLEVLRILRDKGVKATFFVVGASAALEPNILRKIYSEGHDIGNHTFTHPNLSAVGPTQLDLELNATQRVLEAKLGVGTRLFRPPFNKDAEPKTYDEARTLIRSAALGYITIGLKIDPLDWERPGVEEIVRRTVAYAERQQGNVILLHDGGGDRSQTVAALPQIIDRLHAKGFSFVPVHELLGLTRAEAMPSLQDSTSYAKRVNNAGLSAASTFSAALASLFIVAIVLGVGRLAVIVVGAVVHSRRVKERVHLRWEPSSLAILVPAYNEEDVICDCVASLVDCHDDAQILVVDDGSSDRTFDILREAYGQHPRVSIFRKLNSGKASALNFALTQTDAEIIIAVDADTRLDVAAVHLLVRHFVDPCVAAVAGSVQVGNQGRLITRFQALEYIISQNLDRRALEVVNGIIVVPGAVGAWRRDAVLSVGAYENDTLAEDADLTVKLQRAGWRVLYEPRAFAHTEAPQTIRLFLRQRFRWMFGMLQVAYKHLGALREPGAPGVKYLAIPNIVLFQFVLALISPVIDILLVARIVGDIYYYQQHGLMELSPGTRSLLLYWVTWQILEFAVAVVAFRLDGQRVPGSLLPLLVLQRFCYRQLIYYVVVKTMAAAVKGHLIDWDKLPRQGLGVSPVRQLILSPACQIANDNSSRNDRTVAS